jgi:hypothetical protein
MKEIGDAGFLIFLNFRKPAPRSQGCEVRAFLNLLDTVECGKFLAHFFHHFSISNEAPWIGCFGAQVLTTSTASTS